MDKLVAVFPHVTLTSDLRAVLRNEPGGEVVATIGYSSDKLKKAGITINGLTDLRQMSAITGYATALEDLHKPSQGQYR